MALTDQSRKRTIIFLIIILSIIILIVAGILSGFKGIVAVIKTILIIMIVLGILGFLFYIIYFVFFKYHRRDIAYENWKSYLTSAKDNGADMMGDLVLIGDKNHSSKRFFTITGYLRIKAFDGKEYDLFSGKKKPMNLFEEEKIVMVSPEDHSDLVGDVYIYGISLVQKYGYYFLNKELLNYDLVDNHIAYDTYRTIMYTNLGDLKGIVDRATGLDPDYAKERQREKLLKIPVLEGQQK